MVSYQETIPEKSYKIQLNHNAQKAVISEIPSVQTISNTQGQHSINMKHTSNYQQYLQGCNSRNTIQNSFTNPAFRPEPETDYQES